MGAKQGEFRELITAMFRERHKKPHLTVNLLRQHWADILGQELADKTYPARISRQTLWINALDASWAYQLQFMKHELLESVQVFMGATEITDLRFKEGNLHPPGEEAQTKDTGSSSGDPTIASTPASAEEGREMRGGADGDAPDGMVVRDSADGGGMSQGERASKDIALNDITLKDREEDREDDREEESAKVTTAVIPDDSLRKSFHRWAQLKKRKTPSGA